MTSRILPVFWIAHASCWPWGYRPPSSVFRLAAELVTGREMGNVMGVVSLGPGIFGWFGPQMLGWLRDWTGGFNAGWCFLGAGGCPVADHHPLRQDHRPQGSKLTRVQWLRGRFSRRCVPPRGDRQFNHVSNAAGRSVYFGQGLYRLEGEWRLCLSQQPYRYSNAEVRRVFDRAIPERLQKPAR